DQYNIATIIYLKKLYYSTLW
ncbi:hypothetical protein EC960932_4388, partial [Escherichia coli 96.0932]